MIKKISKRFNSRIKDKDNKEVVTGGAAAFLMRSVSIVASYVFTFLIARIFGAAGSGIYAIFQSVLQFFATLAQFGFDTLMMRSVAQYSANGKWGKVKDLYFKALGVTVSLGILFSVLIFFTSDFIAGKIFLKPALSGTIKIAGFSILPLVVINIHADCLRGMKKILLFSFLEGVCVLSIASILFVIGFFVFKNDYLPLVAYLLALVITALIAVRWWWKKSPVSDAVINETVNLAEKVSVAFTLFSNAMLQIFRGWTDTFLLGRFGSEEAVGIYKVAFRISTITSLTLTAILLAVAPKIAELYAKGEMKKMTLVTQNATKLIFWTSVPALVLFILFPEFFLGIFGEEFKAGATILVILSMGQFINAACGPVGNVLIMTGKQRVNRNIQFVSTVVTVILNAVFIPRYGITAAALVSLTGYALSNFIPMFFVKYYYGFYTIHIQSLFSFKLAAEKKEV